MASVDTRKAAKVSCDPFSDIIDLSFDLADASIVNSPKYLEDAFRSDSVQKAISRSLQTFMEQRAEAGLGRENTPTLTSKEAIALFHDLKQAQDPLEDAFLKQIAGTYEYQKLVNAIKNFKSSCDNDSFACWTSNNGTILHVTGAALLIGGAVAAYYSKLNGPVMKAAVNQLKGKPLLSIPVSNFKLTGKMIDFQPRKSLSANMTGSYDWKEVNLTTSFGVTAKNLKAQSVNGAVVHKLGPISLGANATYTLPTDSFNLGLTMDATNDFATPKVEVAAIWTRGKPSGVKVTAGIEIPRYDASLNLSGETNSKGDTVMLKLNIGF